MVRKFAEYFVRTRFLMSKVYPCLFMTKTIICVVYVGDRIFWARSQSEIDNSMNSFKEDGPSYNWEHSKGESVSDVFGIGIKTSDGSGFQFFRPDLSAKYWKPQGCSMKTGSPLGISA